MKVHFIKNEKTHVAYFPETYRFFSINDRGRELIKFICDNKRYSELSREYNLTEDDFKQYQKNISSYAMDNNIQPHVEINNAELQLNRLAINITNSCNLACKYCYANGGSYLTEDHIMPLEILEVTLDKFFNKFDRIDNLQLFGGEPLMSMRNIEFVCKYVEKVKSYRKYPTSIGLVTNGTLISDKFIELVNKYDIQVTVSFDGTNVVNDINRIYINGKGSSGVIIDKVNKLRNATNQPTQIEVTYNKSHLDNDVKVIDCVNTCNELFPGIGIHLVPAGGAPNDDFVISDISVMVDSVDDVFDNWREEIHSYSLVDRIIRALITKQGNRGNICDAGAGTLSVSTKGNIYPCFMFTDNDSLKLGTVFDKDILSGEGAIKRLRNLEKFNNKGKNKKCQVCFLNTMCNGCLGLNELNSGQFDVLSEKDCNMHRKMAEKVILRMTERMETNNV